MASNEKWGMSLVALGLLIVLGLLAWVAWGGARTATEALDVAPRIEAPSLGAPNLPEVPRLPDAPVPTPK